MQVPGGDLLADVLDGGDGDGTAAVVLTFIYWLAARVDAGPVAASANCLSPREQVAGLFGEHPATLLLVKEEDGAGWEALAARGGDGRGCVGTAEGLGLGPLLLCGED